jgi:hypothetical protein
MSRRQFDASLRAVRSRMFSNLKFQGDAPMLNVLHMWKRALQMLANEILSRAIITQFSSLHLAYQSRELRIFDNLCVFVRCVVF